MSAHALACLPHDETKHVAFGFVLFFFIINSFSSFPLSLWPRAGAQESSVALEGPGNFVCPHEFGFYAHELSCDKYYSCEAGVPTLKVCGNGLAFDNSDPENLRENCDYSHNVDCGLRTQLGTPGDTHSTTAALTQPDTGAA